jgi:hypothetical protein
LYDGYIVGSSSKAMAELQKPLRSFTSLTGEPDVKANKYNVATTAYKSGQWALAYVPAGRANGNVGTECNAFAIGLELQSHSNRTIMSGINTLDTQVFFTANIANSPKMLPISALGSPIRVEYFLSANDEAIC